MGKRLAGLIDAWRKRNRRGKAILSDVLGSYTGVPEEADDPPEQDADDL
jgi:hypothetical protein